jgi:integrase
VRVITQRDIRQLRDALMSEYEARGGRDGRATIQAVLRMLRAVFSQAIRDGVTLPRGNPATYVRSTKPDPREARVLDRTEVDALADEVPAQYRALLLVLARWASGSGGQLRSAWATSTSYDGASGLSDRRRGPRRWMAGGCDQDWEGAHRPNPALCARRAPDSHRGLCGREGRTPVHESGRRTAPSEQLAEAGLVPGLRARRARGALDPEKALPHVHDLRHTAAILAMDDGVPPKVIQDILGHASFKMTMDLYAARASEELMDQAAEAMDSAHRKRTGEKGWESANLVQSGQEELEQG